ncbi:MAG TPA: DEAD/DEAH box helicase [Terriglobales bacterium]|nr:DEAD/DEAH box helicase [Terriglobales bacterium]
MTDYLTPLDDWLAAPTNQLREQAFAASQFAASEIAEQGIRADVARDIVIRLLALAEQRTDDLADFRPMIESLTREVGLFPYVDETVASFSDQIAREAFRSESDPSLIFHIEQQRIFNSLLEGHNVVASAPTSFGKSLIIDSMLGQSHVERAAIIVPTLALLDETRRRIVSKIQEDTTIVFHRSQIAPTTGKVIFIGTQERLLDRDDIQRLDLLIVDEFYKADPSRSDGRFVALNAAISKLSRITRQFFLIGPFIDGIDARGWRYADVDFIKTAYRTVSFDPVDVQSSQDDVETLAKFLASEANQPALVFVKSPQSATELAKGLVAAGLNLRTKWSEDLSQWIAENYTPAWPLVDALESGIGYHHGRMPRALASALVRGFNRGEFKILLCTSTLIEGVNTAAKSVFIWDKKIDGRDVDYFTFSNIRGRAGRMGRHYVGKVFYFHPTPAEEQHDVEVPGLGTGGDIDEILVHYDAAEIPQPAQQRITDWLTSTGLSMAELRRYGGLGFERIARLKAKVDALSPDAIQLLSWQHLPRYRELEATVELVWGAFNLTRSGARSARQLTWLLWQLYREPSLAAFLRTIFDGERPMVADDLFGFLRSCEFSLPEMLMCLQTSLVRNVESSADYSLFVAMLENWFKPEAVKSLEEVGFPIVLFERLGLSVSDDATVDDTVERAMRAIEDREDVTAIEREMVSDARSVRGHIAT